MASVKDEAFDQVLEPISAKIEAAFWELDAVMAALSVDAPVHVAEAWAALHKGMSPEFIAKRYRLRGVLPEEESGHADQV